MNKVLDCNIKEKAKCEVCVKGKATRSPFKEEGTRANELLERIHSDVCGPMAVSSFSGAKYFVSFIDDCSRKVFVYTMKSKSEVYAKFVDFKAYVENQLSSKIKILRSDNGKEYMNKNFEKLCAVSGIKHETTVPYTPEQNGMCERMNRTLIEKVRCMLIDMNLNKSLWAEALHAAANIVNALPNEKNKKSPDEMWFKVKPDLSNFKVFGCKALVMIPYEKRKKLDDKAIECIYLRRAENSKAFRLFNKETRDIIISRDVVFYEKNGERK